MIANFILEFAPVLKGNRVHSKVAMDIFGVQMHRHKYLIPVTPHPAGRFLADLKCHLRRDLARPKALDSMIGYHAATIAKAFLNGHHFPVGILLGAVDPSHEHGTVRLGIIGGVFQRVVEVAV